MITELLGISPIIEKELGRYNRFFLERLVMSGYTVKDESDLLNVEEMFSQHLLQYNLHLHTIQAYRNLYRYTKEHPEVDKDPQHPIHATLDSIYKSFPFHPDLLFPDYGNSRTKNELAKAMSRQPFIFEKPLLLRRSDYKRHKPQHNIKIMKKQKIEFPNHERTVDNFSAFLKVTKLLRAAQKEAERTQDPNKIAYAEKLEQRYDMLLEKFTTPRIPNEKLAEMAKKAAAV